VCDTGSKHTNLVIYVVGCVLYLSASCDKLFVCFLLGDSLASEVYMPTLLEHSFRSIFIGG
jgi:hypothetical protein